MDFPARTKMNIRMNKAVSTRPMVCWRREVIAAIVNRSYETVPYWRRLIAVSAQLQLPSVIGNVRTSRALMNLRTVAGVIGLWLCTAHSFSQQLQKTSAENWATQAIQSVEITSEPHIFGEGVISTPDYEFNASFTPDGKAVYFSKSDPVFSRISIVQSEWKGSKWSLPQMSSFSGQWKDTDPYVSADGNKLFFASDRSTDGSLTARKDYDLWYVEKSKTGWGAPVHLPAPINTDDMDVYPSLAANG